MILKYHTKSTIKRKSKEVIKKKFELIKIKNICSYGNKKAKSYSGSKYSKMAIEDIPGIYIF